MAHIWDDIVNVDFHVSNSNTVDSVLEQKRDLQYRSYCEKTYQVIKEVEDIGLPKKNEQLRLITFRVFNAAVFIAHIAEQEGIEHMAAAIYSINHEAARLINDLVESKKVESATILMSNLRNKAHRVKEQITRDMFVNNPNIDLFFCQSHAKIISAKTKKGNYYTIEGSGNMAFNSKVEQYSIENNIDLYDFTVGWMKEVRQFLQGTKELIET